MPFYILAILLYILFSIQVINVLFRQRSEIELSHYHIKIRIKQSIYAYTIN